MKNMTFTEEARERLKALLINSPEISKEEFANRKDEIVSLLMSYKITQRDRLNILASYAMIQCMRCDLEGQRKVLADMFEKKRLAFFKQLNELKEKPDETH